MNERQRLATTGSGVSQVKNPFLRTLARIGDVAGTVLAPGVAAAIPGTTLHHEELIGDQNRRIATDQGEEQEQAKTSLTQEQAAEAARMANAPAPESPNAGKTVTVNGRIRQFDPKTQGYDVDLGPAKATAWTPQPTLGVEVNEATGETRPMMVGGQPVAPPATPERDKQQMQALEKSLTAGTISPTDRATLQQLQTDAKLTGTKPEIIAQVGNPPVPAAFPKGMADPQYRAAEAAWGKAYEKVANEEAGASGAARGAGYNETRPMSVFNPATGQFEIMKASDAEAAHAAAAGVANTVMGRQAQIADIQSGSQSLRQALTEPGLTAFAPTQVAKLSLAMRDVDPGAMRNAVTDLFASGLTPPQQDLVASLFSMQERALSLRSVAGMGQGSDAVRRAIVKALPNITSGSTQLALKQLDAFDNLVGNLAKGIGGIKGSAAAPSGSASGYRAGDKRTYQGATYEFKGGDPTLQENWVKQQ